MWSGMSARGGEKAGVEKLRWPGPAEYALQTTLLPSAHHKEVFGLERRLPPV